MKKGFTLVELIVSFVIISILTIGLFKTTLSVQQNQEMNVEYNEFIAFTAMMNDTIQYDFLTDKVLNVVKHDDNYYSIKYENLGSIELKYEDGIFYYSNEKFVLPKSYSLYSDIEFTTYVGEGEGYNSYLLLRIPLKSKFYENTDDLKYMYMLDSSVAIVPKITEETVR